MHDRSAVEGALEASKKGNVEVLEKIALGPGGWPEVVDDRGATAVHYAARGGSVAALEWLVVGQGCEASGRSHVGATPAMDAAAAGALDALRWLLGKNGCSVGDTDDSGASAIHLSARYGHVTTVQWLLLEGGAMIGSKTRTGATPLHFAATKGHLDTVRSLVEYDPSIINAQMENGVTPAYLASQEGRLETLRYLAEEGGANIRTTAFDGMSCLHSAAQMGRLHCVAWLVVTGKIGPNEYDFDGATALHFAAGRGHAHVLHWLMINGAKVIQDNLGGSPLHDAAEHGHLKCVRVLLKHGCDPALKDNNEMTAADLAENCWHRDCAATLRRRLVKGVNGVMTAPRERPSVRDLFSKDYVNMNGVKSGFVYFDGKGTPNGLSDYVDYDSGSDTSSTYVVYTDYSRSSGGLSYDGSDIYYPRSILRGSGHGQKYFTIPPPPDSPPPPVPCKQTDHAEVSSIQSTTSASSQSETADYENLRPGEMAALVQMNKAVEGEVSQGAIHGGGAVHGAGPIPWMDASYPTDLPLSPLSHRVLGVYKPVLARYQPSGRYGPHDDHRHRLQGMSSRLMEIIERDSEMGSRPQSLDVLDDASPTSPGQAPNEPPLSAPPAPPPPPPPPPPLPVATPPATIERWKKASQGSRERHGSLPNVSVSTGDAPHYVIRPTVKNSSSNGPNIDLITELKAANGMASLKRTKRVDKEASVADSEKDSESSIEKDPKQFWKQLQKRSSSPQHEMKPQVQADRDVTSPVDVTSGSDVVSNGDITTCGHVSSNDETHSDSGRPDSIKLREEFSPKNFLSDAPKTDASGTEIPIWKRMIIARQLAEKAQREADEKQRLEEEQNRYKNIPAWKRALIAKKEKETQEKAEKKQNKKTKDENETEKTNETGSKRRGILERTPPVQMESGPPSLAPWQLELRSRKTTRLPLAAD